jgi:hypothetical protein
MRRLPSLLVSLLLVAVLPQCGGAAGPEPKAAGAEDSESSDRSKGADEGESDKNDEGPSAAEEKSHGPSCDDGTCSLCGSGICPAGWYCDESAPGGAACAWLKECAEKATCGCVTKVLGSSCKCRDESGVKVSCN